MEQGEHMHEGYAGTGGLDALLVLLLAVAVVVGLALLIRWLLSRRRPEVSPEEAAQAEIRGNLEGQIMAMLHQAGGAMSQSDIRAALGLSVEEVAAVLRRLEEEGRILRTWQAQEYTFSVRTR
jgi:uncharacterized membrane protein